MNLFQAIILIGLLGNTALGLFVLLSNPKRSVNIGFFSLVLFMTFWLGSMFLVTLSEVEPVIRRFVSQTSAFAGLIPLGVIILQAAIIDPNITISQTLHKLRYWLLAGLLVVVLCYSPVFVLSSDPLATELIPATEYGWGFPVYILYFVCAISLMTVSFWKAASSKSGVQKTEIQFLQMGCIFSFIIGISLAVLAEVFDTREIALFVPLSVLVLDGFVAYGIATRRILSVSVVLQRLTAYVLMVIYLIAVYAVTVWGVSRLFYHVVDDSTYLSHLLGALVVAFSVVPAHGWMHVFSRRILSITPFNVDEILTRAGAIFREMSTDEQLMDSFSSLISSTFETSRVVLLRPADGSGYIQCYPTSNSEDAISLQPGSRIVQLLERDHEPFTVDTLRRMRPTAVVTGAIAEMTSSDAAIALGSFSHNELRSVLFLSSKKSGGIYDLREQLALQLLSDQLAVAMENARLYTEIQDGKIYNEILLDSLSSGIVAVNQDRKVTVFNQRAQDLTGLAEEDVVEGLVDGLPRTLAESITKVLETDKGFRDRDLSIVAGEETVPIRASGSVFHGHTGEILGALLVFYDMTLLKKMEEQIRRADRLSSIGTLSAGMAHEIKNPLVTIKTFTQLLPHQFGNDDFRETFFELVGQEVMRIDTIVNRLLNFARPAKAALRPASLHEAVENSLHLIEQQLAQKDISLQTEMNARHHMIEADTEQLNQTFINFFLNAVHAMDPGGTLSVRTSLAKSRVQLDIKDTGHGISAEKLKRIFDPFFTTKEEGIGLGLSVSHGILMEHNATINVESEEGKGTIFHLSFPLLKTKGAGA